jgi:cytochrome c
VFSISRFVVSWLAAFVVTLVTSSAQEARTIWDGVFTEAQATRGRASYKESCASCHLDDLLGQTPAPPLVGEAFAMRWAGGNVDDMLQTVKRSMPQEAPDSLTMQAYVDIIAYVLKANGAAAGAAELPTERARLQAIVIKKSS